MLTRDRLRNGRGLWAVMRSGGWLCVARKVPQHSAGQYYADAKPYCLEIWLQRARNCQRNQGDVEGQDDLGNAFVRAQMLRGTLIEVAAMGFHQMLAS